MSESTSTMQQGQDTQQPNPPIPEGEDSVSAAAAAAAADAAPADAAPADAAPADAAPAAAASSLSTAAAASSLSTAAAASSLSTAAAASSLSTAASVDEDVKKRKLENGGFHSSQYFKIRSIVKDLRPFFVEVSRSPNFRESKAAHEIQKRMKTMIELTKQFTASISKHDETHAKEPLSGSFEREQAKEPQEGGEQAPQPQPSEDIAAIEQKKGDLKELVNLGEEFSGPFLIGGSPIGWNFIVYPGHKPVYCGVSKESALAQRADK